MPDFGNTRAGGRMEYYGFEFVAKNSDQTKKIRVTTSNAKFLI